MKAGDLIRWHWHVGPTWDDTEFIGVVLNTRIAKTDYEKLRIFSVLAQDGAITEVREDEPTLELVS